MKGEASGRSTATVIVEARDLDTDGRVQETVVVACPSDATEQGAQLAEAAAKFYPSARMRSFADGAATFLDRQHLIVAFYADLPSPPERARRAEAGPQAPLFAA